MTRRGVGYSVGSLDTTKPGGSNYYPASLQPLDLDCDGLNHTDVNILTICPANPDDYRRDLNSVLTSHMNAVHYKQRLETKIKKASIFDGLPCILELPTCSPETSCINLLLI